MDKGTGDIMSHISANNNGVSKRLTFCNGSCQIFEEGIDGVTVIIVIVKVFALLSIKTEGAGCVPSWAVDGV